MQNQNDFNHFLRAFEFLDYLRSARRGAKEEGYQVGERSDRAKQSCRWLGKYPLSLSLCPFFCFIYFFFPSCVVVGCISFPHLWLCSSMNYLPLCVYIYIYYIYIHRIQSVISQSRTVNTYVVHFAFKHHRNHEHAFSQESLQTIYWLAVHGN